MTLVDGSNAKRIGYDGLELASPAQSPPQAVAIMTNGNTGSLLRSPQWPSRRRFGGLLATAGLLPAILPILPGRAAAENPPIYYTWSGYDDPNFFPSYVAKHGGPPIMQTFLDESEALEHLKGGLQVDVMHPCNGQIRTWRDAGILQPIDTTRLSHWPDVLDPLKTIPGAMIDGQQWFIPIDWAITSVIYRPDLVDIKEDSFALLWDERYAGRMAVGQDASDTVTIAGIVAGARDPFAMTDEELARAKQLLLKQKPLIKFYWSDWNSVNTALTSGEVVASTAWPDAVVTLKRQGVPVKFMNPKEGAISFACGVVLAKQATEIDAAYDLIDAMLAPEAGKWVIEAWGYGHSNRKSLDVVDPEAWVDTGMPRDVTQLLTHGHFTREFERYDVMQSILDEVMGVS